MYEPLPHLSGLNRQACQGQKQAEEQLAGSHMHRPATAQESLFFDQEDAARSSKQQQKDMVSSKYILE